VREGNVYVLHHTGNLIARMGIPHDDCPYNEGGPPTVADFDGDGVAEIGVAGADFYVVFDLDCIDSSQQGCEGEGILWRVPNYDCSSRATGSSVFDFEADGIAEVIYNDERNFRIFRGYDGFALFEWPNYSHTRLEYPVIVDVDNDGNAEIIFIENRYGGTESGVEIWGDRLDNWVPTRRIWNQHSYHITNVNEDASIPLSEEPNWLISGLNNFRQNVQLEGVYNAPDLVVTDLSADLAECEEALILIALVKNEGSRGVGAGLSLSFYEGEPGVSEDLLGVIQTRLPLLPGGSEEVSFRWLIPEGRVFDTFNFFARVDDDGDGTGQHSECIEDNNTATLPQIGCGLICPPEVSVPSEEVCNRIDDDCDGWVDEELVVQCHSQCGDGIERCINGLWSDCSAPLGEEEVCDGLDNDCDGEVDEGVLNPCGMCGDTPEERCDGMDNDCDGQVDEGEICAEDEICYCGSCAPRCVRGECEPQRWCNEEGYCIKDDCPDGLICVDGRCER
jgi:hypothetical protein